MGALATGVVSLVLGCAVVACGPDVISSVRLSTPEPVPSSSPVTVVQQIAVTLPAATATSGATAAVALPTAAGFTPTMLLPLPQTATNAQLTVLISNVIPASAPPLSLERVAQAVRHTTEVPSGAAMLLYCEISSSATLTLPTAPGFTFVIPAADVFASATYYLALYDPTRPSLGWQYGFEGRATTSGSTLTFAPKRAAFTLAGNLNYYFALYVLSHFAPQPTPAPSITPTTVPSQTPSTPLPTATPAGAGGTVSINVPTPSPVLCTPTPAVVAVGQTVPLLCTAQGYAAPFTWTVADPTIASVQQYNAETLTLFNVTGLKAGTTTVSFRTLLAATGSATLVVSP